MKKIYLIPLILVLLYTSCADLDVTPLGKANTGGWYSTGEEIEIALNGLYKGDFWNLDDDFWGDDESRRDNNFNDIQKGTISPGWQKKKWLNSYKAIARANLVIANSENSAGVLSEALKNQYVGEAKFFRASEYAYLITRWGNVPLHLKPFEGDIDKLAEQTVREEKSVILQAIYSDYDDAAKSLPARSNAKGRVSKGAAYAMKARIALYMNDWNVVRDAAKACIDEGGYELYPDYSTLFLEEGDKSSEIIFSVPRSYELNIALNKKYPVMATITRLSGGWAQYNPSWHLFASYLCTDGLPIDESSLFDPQNPFENRDPRCKKTIVEFGTMYLGQIYQPHPDSINVLTETGDTVMNVDTRSVTQHATHNGLIKLKGIDRSWSELEADNDKVIIRYADVLLMYAEALIELNEDLDIAQNYINKVRERAYNQEQDPAAYPKVEATTQAELRKAVRIERRMELALEGLRYMDLIRWESIEEKDKKLAERVLNQPTYGMLTVGQFVREDDKTGLGVISKPEDRSGDIFDNLIDKNLWFWGEVPEIDEDGHADFTSMLNNGYCRVLVEKTFHAPKMFLWPIPENEMDIHPHWNNNDGY